MPANQDTHSDQLELFNQLLADFSALERSSQQALSYAAWAATWTTGSSYVADLVTKRIGNLDTKSKRDVEFAIARMGVTNPYFMAREFAQLNNQTSLANLNFRPFAELAIQDEVAYHHACIACSLINQGYVCLRSHISSLQQSGISDQTIDTTLRLASVCHALSIVDNISN